MAGTDLVEMESLQTALADLPPPSEPWLNWQPMTTFPSDGNPYLAIDDRVNGGFPQIVFWDEGALRVSDAKIVYGVRFFTHWARVPLPTPSS